MAIVLLIVVALFLPAALLYLTLSVNDFEKNTKALAAVLMKRYHQEPPKKSSGTGMTQGVLGPGREAGKPGKP